MHKKLLGLIFSTKNANCLRLTHRLRFCGKSTHFGYENYPNIFLSVAFLLFWMPNVYASVAGEVNKANDLYKQGKFDDSLDLYQAALDKDDKSPVVKYDLGTALYKKGDYEKALQYLQQAAQDENLKIKPKVEYNLGNVLYKSGIQKENTNIDQAIKSLQDALGYYGQSINDDPKDQDAVYNQDFVRKEIERLKQKKQEQQEQQNQQQNQNQQDQKNQQGQQSQKNQQDQKNQQQQESKQDQQKQEQQQAQEQQNKSQDKKNQQSANQSQEDKQKKAQEEADQMQKQIDRKQAEDLLEDYRENEEPKKLLNYMPKKIDDRPVLKDW